MSKQVVSLDGRQPPASHTRRRRSGCRLFGDGPHGAHRVVRHGSRERGCDHHHEVDDIRNHAARELSAQRLDRTYAEILQEVRVAQTGVQCILAFVLTLAFTSRFNDLSGSELRLYLATLVLGAVAASLLMAPAAFNRLVLRRRLRRRLIIAANRFALFGLIFLLATIGCAVMLILRVVVGSSGLAALITAGLVTWFVLIWFAMPAWWRYRHRGCGSARPTPAEHDARPATGPPGAHRPTSEVPAPFAVVVDDLDRRPHRRARKVMVMTWQPGQPGDLAPLRARWKALPVRRTVPVLGHATTDRFRSVRAGQQNTPAAD
jgi:hypothetical protein